MKIFLSKANYEIMVSYAIRKAPIEACGLIAGECSGEVKTIKRIYFLKNIDNSEDHFSIDPVEQLKSVRDMRSVGLIPLGNWHSHPNTPSRPSKEDIRLAYDGNASYLILSLLKEHPVLNSFRIQGNIVSREELIIE